MIQLVGLAWGKGIAITVADLFHHSKLLDIASLIGTFHTFPLSLPNVLPFSLLPVPDPQLFLQEIISPRIGTSVNNIADAFPVTDLQASFVANQHVNYFFVDLGQAVDIERLKDSCVHLVEFYETLRSAFIAHQGKTYQVVLRELRLHIAEYETKLDLQEFSETLCSEDFQSAANLEKPLTQFMLIKHRVQKARLIIRMSHAQYDGFCLPRILDGLANTYQRFPLRQESDFSLYIHYTASQNNKAYEHWRHLLHGSTMTSVKTTLNHHIPKTDALKKLTICRVVSVLNKPRNITAATLITAAWSLVLAKVTKVNDVCFGQVVVGRNAILQDIHNIVGPCVNVVPVRVKFFPSSTNMDTLLTVQEQYLSLGAADSVGLTEIVDRRTSWPRGTLFDSIVQHQNVDENPEFRLENTTTRVQGFSKFIHPTLAIVSYEVGKELRLTVNTNNHFLSHSIAEMLLAQLCAAIETIDRNLKAHVSSFICSART